jgi:hypothetical protein
MELVQERTRISEIFGGIMALGLIAYFLGAYYLGIVMDIELRYFNFVIILLIEYLALRKTRSRGDGTLPYVWCVAVGTVSAVVGVTIFAIFLFIVFQMDHYLYQAVVAQSAWGGYLTHFLAPFGAWLEGILCGMIASHILANLMHTDKELMRVDR